MQGTRHQAPGTLFSEPRLAVNVDSLQSMHISGRMREFDWPSVRMVNISGAGGIRRFRSCVGSRRAGCDDPRAVCEAVFCEGETPRHPATHDAVDPLPRCHDGIRCGCFHMTSLSNAAQQCPPQRCTSQPDYRRCRRTIVSISTLTLTLTLIRPRPCERAHKQAA